MAIAEKSVINELNFDKPNNETQEKIYLLGFMTLPEVNNLVLNELGESYNLDRVKKLWLPKKYGISI